MSSLQLWKIHGRIGCHTKYKIIALARLKTTNIYFVNKSQSQSEYEYYKETCTNKRDDSIPRQTQNRICTRKHMLNVAPFNTGIVTPLYSITKLRVQHLNKSLLSSSIRNMNPIMRYWLYKWSASYQLEADIGISAAVQYSVTREMYTYPPQASHICWIQHEHTVYS